MSADLKQPGSRGLARLAVVIACGAFGSILMLVAVTVIWPTVGPLAYVGVATIGSVAGGAIGAIALEIRLKNLAG